MHLCFQLVDDQALRKVKHNEQKQSIKNDFDMCPYNKILQLNLIAN